MAASSASSPVSLVVVNSATGDWRLDIINPAATDETVTLSMPMHPDGDETGRTWSATTQMTTGLAASGIDEIDVSFTLAAHGKVTFSGRSTFADGAKRVSILYTSTMLAKTYLGYINFFFTDDHRPIANDVDLPKNFFDEHALTQTDLDGFFNGRWTMSEVISYLRSNQNSTAFNPDGLTIEVIGDQATVNMANAVMPRKPAEMLAEVKVPLAMWVGAEDEIIDPLKLATLLYVPGRDRVAEAVNGATHQSLLLRAADSVGPWLQQQATAVVH